jgi:hypothetical protein
MVMSLLMGVLGGSLVPINSRRWGRPGSCSASRSGSRDGSSRSCRSSQTADERALPERASHQLEKLLTHGYRGISNLAALSKIANGRVNPKSHVFEGDLIDDSADKPSV